MNVAFIHPNWPGSEGTGATYSATRTVTELKERGHDISVYCPERPDDESQLIDELDYRFLDTDGFPYHPSYQINRALRAHTEEFDAFDVLHSYQMRAIPAIEDIGRDCDVATVVTLNAYFGVCAKNDLLYENREHCTGSSASKCARCIATAARQHDGARAKHALVLYGNLSSILAGKKQLHYLDGCRAPTEHVRDNYARHEFPAERIEVIPHILDDSFAIEHRSSFEPPYQLLYVGYLEPWKGVTKLVPLVDTLRARGVDVELTVVGDGSCLETLQSQTRQRDLNQRITFEGRVPNEDLPETYASHDVFVYPGIWEEPLGRVYLEALASGTPVLSTEYGTISEIIGAGGETAPADVEALAEQLQSMITGGLKSYSTAATTQAEEFRADQVIPKIEALYRTAIERKDRRVRNRASP